MGYRIQYPTVRKLRNRGNVRVRLPVLTVFIFFLFLVLVRLLWPEGAQQLQNCVPVSVLDEFASELRKGDGIMTSFSAFLKSFLYDPV